MIAVRNLTVHAGSFSLSGISFNIPARAYGVLMGKTGSGKTTLLEAVCGLRPAASGSIELCGRDVTRLKAADRGIGYVPQDRALFPSMTVGQHLSFALKIRKWESVRIERRVNELAELLGIEKLLSRFPQGLSGGEAQRVALGRALSASPRILILDEPLGALDDETRQEMCVLLKAVMKQTQVTALHITHSRSEARMLSDIVLKLESCSSIRPEEPGSAVVESCSV